MGRPFVKTWVDERELAVLFLLDLSASMTGGFSHWTARQTAARLCACLALSAARNDDKVGLVAFSEQVDGWVAPKKGAGHTLRIIRDCLALEPSSPRTDLRAALSFAARVVRRKAIVFLVSDFQAAGWEDALTLCARRHDVVAVRLLVPEGEPPARGLMRVRDPETGAEAVVDWSDRRVREAHARHVADHRATVDAALGRAGVDRMDVHVPRTRDPDAIARPILRFFRMRELRGEKR
jgi:uncharacterized protein (DUF58 family)